MTRAVVGLLAAGLVAGPVLAADSATDAGRPDPFGALQNLCIANEGQTAAVLAKADAQGWAPAPDALKAQLSKGAFQPDGIRIRQDGSATEVLVLTRVDVPPFHGRALVGHGCLFLAEPVDVSAVRSQIATWVGLPRGVAQSSPTSDSYAYLEDGGPRRPANMNPHSNKRELEESTRALEAGTVRMLVVAGDGPSLKIAYIIPKM